MAFVLGARSRARLVGVRADLIGVVGRAIALTEQDFAVTDGVRTEEEQRKLVAKGASKTMNSKHRKQADGFGHAVDLVPWVNGTPRWEWPLTYPVAAAVLKAARDLNVKLRWGAVWDRTLDQLCDPSVTHLPRIAANLEAEVQGYVTRRRKLGKRAFIDGPHFELLA
jgi:peptidoglycan L-alanyl-D-glutamate endopeptidase CwlK